MTVRLGPARASFCSYPSACGRAQYDFAYDYYRDGSTEWIEYPSDKKVYIYNGSGLRATIPLKKFEKIP